MQLLPLKNPMNFKVMHVYSNTSSQLYRVLCFNPWTYNRARGVEKGGNSHPPVFSLQKWISIRRPSMRFIPWFQHTLHSRVINEKAKFPYSHIALIANQINELCCYIFRRRARVCKRYVSGHLLFCK